MNDRFKFRAIVNCDYHSKDNWDDNKTIDILLENISLHPLEEIGTFSYKFEEALRQNRLSDYEVATAMEILEDNSNCSDSEYLIVDAKRIMQCTGLKDKNGKLIYEGDILEGDKTIEKSPINSQIVLKRGLVKIPDGMFVATCQDMKENCTLFTQVNWNKTEIIGNIYQNKELLNEN